MSINGVVLDERRHPLPINSLERTKLTISPVTLELTTGLGYPGVSNSYYAQGILTCTNYRLVFVTDPALPLFDSFMVTWNKIDPGFLTSKRPWWMRPFGKLFSPATNDSTIFECLVHPLEDEPQLTGEATLRITLPDAEQARILSQLVKDSRWTGHLDPENSAEPPPAYPTLTQSGPVEEANPGIATLIPPPPPPCYEQAILICNTDPRVCHSAVIEKYRPRMLADIVGNEEIVRRLQVIAETGNMPHILLSGSPGVGKTTSILCLASQLLGPTALKEAVLELNASDDRGIEVVRNQIKQFATKKVILPPGRHKIVILDEADSMTPGAQQALRRIMEQHAGTTRFALACNNSSKIIEPIQSRCAILRYGRLTQEQILRRLLQVCQAEQVKYAPEGLEALLFTADGDMRQAINNLQATVAGFSFVSAENVYRVCDSPHPTAVEAIIQAAKNGQMDKAQAGLEELLVLGYAPIDLISTFFRVVKFMGKDVLPEPLQLEFIREIGLTHMRILEGVGSKLQLCNLLANLTIVASGRQPLVELCS